MLVTKKADGGIILTASHNPKNWNALKLFNSKGEFLIGEEAEEIFRIVEEGKGTLIKIINIIPSSGLLLKRDPGVPIVYTSFAIILIGGSLSLISTNKLWIIYEEEKSLIYIGGISNRNLFGLSKKLPEIISYLDI